MQGKIFNSIHFPAACPGCGFLEPIPNCRRQHIASFIIHNMGEFRIPVILWTNAGNWATDKVKVGFKPSALKV